MIDTYRHQGLRKNLIGKLREMGISDEKVLDAMNRVPRHLFLDSAFDEWAYENKAFPILADQTISQPYTVAFQSQLLQIHPNEKVLEIGTGSGYQTAVLIQMGVKVYTIERQRDLFIFSQKMFKQLRIKPDYQSFGDGYKGLPNFAPFDKIIITAGSPQPPKELLSQLKTGGLMVIPLGKDELRMKSILRISDTQFEKMDFGPCEFVPMLKRRDK